MMQKTLFGEFRRITCAYLQFNQRNFTRCFIVLCWRISNNCRGTEIYFRELINVLWNTQRYKLGFPTLTGQQRNWSLTHGTGECCTSSLHPHKPINTYESRSTQHNYQYFNNRPSSWALLDTEDQHDPANPLELSSTKTVTEIGLSRIAVIIPISNVTPAGPMFFWAPPKMTPNLETSTGAVIRDDEKSATSGTPSGGTGISWNCTPTPNKANARHWVRKDWKFRDGAVKTSFPMENLNNNLNPWQL